MGFNHIPLYKGNEDPKNNWFICENFWSANDLTNKDKLMAQHTTTLRKCALTWFMNITKYQPKSKDEIKPSFLTYLKAQDVKHLETHKLKEIK